MGAVVLDSGASSTFMDATSNFTVLSLHGVRLQEECSISANPENDTLTCDAAKDAEMPSTDEADNNQSSADVQVHGLVVNRAISTPDKSQHWANPNLLRERIVEECKVLCGIRMSKIQGPSPVTRPILVFDENLIALKKPQSHFEQWREDTTLEELQSYAKESWVGLALNVKAPFATAEFGIDRKYANMIGVTATQRLSMEMHRFTRGEIEIYREIAQSRLNPEFTRSLNSALADDLERRLKLRKVFDDWGHVIALRVTVGAERREIFKTDYSKSECSQYQRNEVFASGSGGGGVIMAGGEIKRGKLHDVKDSHSIDRTRLRFGLIGGNASHHRDTLIDELIKGIDEDAPANWRVIERTMMMRTIELIPVADQNRVIRASPGVVSLTGRWIPGNQLIDFRCDGYTLYLPRISQRDANEGWYCLGQSLDSTRALIVKEKDDNNGTSLLQEVLHLNPHWTSANTSFCDVAPGSTKYPQLGSFICSQKLKRSDPACQRMLSDYRICGVHVDLLAPAVYTGKVESNSIRSKLPWRKSGTVWTIGSTLDQSDSMIATDETRQSEGDSAIEAIPEATSTSVEVIRTIDLQLFQVVRGKEEPGWFPLGLRADCIEIETQFHRPAPIPNKISMRKP